MTFESKAIKDFRNDLEVYRDATGKENNEILARQALNYSIKYRKLLHSHAPTASEIDEEAAFRGYKVKVRDSIRDKLGGAYTGKVRRTLKGVVHRNKRSLAVRKELNKRRSSVKCLGRSIAVWASSKNKGLIEGSAPNLGFGYTRGRTSITGRARGSFSKTRRGN